MCGIAGQYSFNAEPVTSEVLKKMTNTIAHRGPDGDGFWVSDSKKVGFGHRRLAIIDLSDTGKQPMRYYGGLTITFNGEIYNYIEIKENLIAKGYSFSTTSDTEVILAAYKEYGEDCLQYFEGMFSFVLWDEEKNKLFAARDRFGEKPFFYYLDNKRFVFASEMKAIFAAGIPKKTSDKLIFNYLAYDVVENYHDKKETFYDHIYQLLPSHCLTIDNRGKTEIKKYWDIPLSSTQSISLEEAKKTFKNLFDESVKRRLRSDVPVGSSLSGGLDSSSVVASIMGKNKLEAKFNTFTARFDDTNFDEGEFVSILNKKYPFTPNFCWPSSDLIIDELDKIFHHQEEPFGTTSIIAQWEVMKLAKQHNVKVLLDGQGADETLAGYFKYYNPFLAELFHRDKSQFKIQFEATNKNQNITSLIDNSYFNNRATLKLKSKVGDLTRPYRIKRITPDLSPEFVNEYKKEPIPFQKFLTLNEVLYNDTFVYGLGKLLRFSDRNSMAFSREVRLPYLSHKLVEFVFSLPAEIKLNDGWTKYLLRTSMQEVIPKEICWRTDKKGFQAPDSWMKHQKVQDMIKSSIETLKKEKYISTPKGSSNWRYIMVDKLINNTSI